MIQSIPKPGGGIVPANSGGLGPKPKANPSKSFILEMMRPKIPGYQFAPPASGGAGTPSQQMAPPANCVLDIAAVCERLQRSCATQDDFDAIQHALATTYGVNVSSLGEVNRVLKVGREFTQRVVQLEHIVLPFVIGVGATVTAPQGVGFTYAVPVTGLLGWLTRARYRPQCATIATGSFPAPPGSLNLTALPDSDLITDAPVAIVSMGRGDDTPPMAARLSFQWKNEYNVPQRRGFTMRYSPEKCTNTEYASCIIIPHSEIEGGLYSPNFIRLGLGTPIGFAPQDSGGPGVPPVDIQIITNPSGFTMNIPSGGAQEGVSFEVETASIADARLDTLWGLLDRLFSDQGGVERALSAYQQTFGAGT